MKTFLERLYLDLRKKAIEWCNYFKIADSMMALAPPEGTDFSAPPLSPLNEKWFQEFAEHPQISSMLHDAMCCCFPCGDREREAAQNRVLLDKVCNRCIEILQKHYDKGDDEVAAFRYFWSLLTLSPNVSETQVFLSLASGYGQEVERLKKKLEREIQHDFVNRTTAYCCATVFLRNADKIFEKK